MQELWPLLAWLHRNFSALKCVARMLLLCLHACCRSSAWSLTIYTQSHWVSQKASLYAKKTICLHASCRSSTTEGILSCVVVHRRLPSAVLSRLCGRIREQSGVQALVQYTLCWIVSSFCTSRGHVVCVTCRNPIVWTNLYRFIFRLSSPIHFLWRRPFKRT